MEKLGKDKKMGKIIQRKLKIYMENKRCEKKRKKKNRI